MKSKILLLGQSLMVAALLPFQGFYSPAHASMPPGYMTTKHMDEKLVLQSSEPFLAPYLAAPLIEDYINRIAPNRDRQHANDLSTADLAQRIAGAAYCFEIDPFVFAALIRKESILYNQYALSPTGAVGYTQFTSIAAREVAEQLGIVPGRALPATTKYLNNVLTSDCLRANGGYQMMGANYKPLWTLAPANQLVKNSKTQVREMAKMMDEYPEYAIVYGVILLKVNLSNVLSGIDTDGVINQDPTASTLNTYREALMLYNGDNATVMRKYQKDIIEVFYPAIVGTKAQ